MYLHLSLEELLRLNMDVCAWCIKFVGIGTWFPLMIRLMIRFAGLRVDLIVLY